MMPWLNQRLNTPWRAAVAMVLAVAALQLLVAPRIGLGVDEAHYALYGRFPALSYFDHPPLVGWLQWLMLHVGEGEFALRLAPIALLAGSALALFGLARELYPQRSPWLATLAVLAFQSGVMVHLVGLGMLPDGPLLLFGLLAMILLVRIAHGASGWHWLALGLLLGLAALSKYTAITLALSAGLTLALFGRWRELARPWLWLGAGVALALCLPILVWNWQNDWISLRYQLGHGTGDFTWSVRKFAMTQLGQFGAYSPGVYVFGWLAVVAAGRTRARRPGDRLSLALALPILLLFGFSGGYATGLPHWPVLGWAALTPMLVGQVAEWWPRKRWVRVLTRFSLGSSAVVLVLLHVLAHLPFNPFPAYGHPLQELVGWDAAATRAVALRAAMQEIQPASEPVVMVRRWTHASRLAWYAWPEPVIVLSGRNRQFHLWYGEPLPGQNGVLMIWARNESSPERWLPELRGRFEHCEWLETLTAQRGGKPVAAFHFFECLGFKD